MPILIRELWVKNTEIARKNGVTLTPVQFAGMFVDSNLVQEPPGVLHASRPLRDVGLSPDINLILRLPMHRREVCRGPNLVAPSLPFLHFPVS